MPTILTTQATPNNTYKISIAFTDEDSNAVTPNDGCTWTLKDSSGNVINSRTAVAIIEDTSVDIYLTGDDLAATGVNDDGIRKFSISGDYDSGSETGLSLDAEIHFIVDTMLPVSLLDAKRQIGFGQAQNANDVQLAHIVKAARENIERQTGRKLLTQTVTEYFPDWPTRDYLELPYGELQSVTSLKYKDSDGTVNTVSTDDYIVETNMPYNKPGRIVLAYGKSWPTATLYPSQPIYAEYVCGFGATAGHVPGDILSAIKLIIADLFENREPNFVGQGFTVTKTKAVERYLIGHKLLMEWNT
jgi:uncharacterized phiE125 gp8 family phage protein